MSEVERDPSAPLPTARTSRPLWPGLVWAIPLAALVVVLFLGVHAFLTRGVNVVVTFESADGVKVGDTKVQYQGFEIGHVVKIDAGGDIGHHRIDVTISLDRRAEPILHTGTVFWLVGSKTSLADLSSVKAAFSGPVIGIAPSFAGAPTHRFRGLSEEPAVLPGTPGTAYVLSADQLGSVRPRSSINYRGQEVGKVTAVTLLGPSKFRVDIFILRPFDSLVRTGTVFWPSSALKLALGAGGVSATAGDPASLLAGGLQMDTPIDATKTPSPPGSHFVIYPSREASQSGPPGPEAPYTIAFAGVGGDLAEGAPVTLLGFPVGEVTSRTLAFDGRTGLPFTHVVVGVDPARLGGGGAAQATDPASLRARADGLLNALLARGYRAKLSQSPPLIGARGVTLERSRGEGAARLIAGSPPAIPAAAAGGDVNEELTSILGKVDRIPIEKIGRDVAAVSGRLRTLLGSPKIDDSLTHLQNTLATADRITAQAEPQVGPLIAKLREAADQAAAASAAARGMLAGDGANPDASLPHAVQELSDAAVSIRALADGLARHPESLIKGKGASK